MRRILARFVLLLAMLMMPLGMQRAAAAPGHHDFASMASGHCPDQAPGHDQTAGFTECTMACAGALPAVEAPPAQAPRAAVKPPPLATTRCLHGLHPETATPPPKRS